MTSKFDGANRAFHPNRKRKFIYGGHIRPVSHLEMAVQAGCPLGLGHGAANKFALNQSSG